MEIVLTLHLGLEITFDLLKFIRFILLPLVRCELEGGVPLTICTVLLLCALRLRVRKPWRQYLTWIVNEFLVIYSTPYYESTGLGYIWGYKKYKHSAVAPSVIKLTLHSESDSPRHGPARQTELNLPALSGNKQMQNPDCEYVFLTPVLFNIWFNVTILLFNQLNFPWGGEFVPPWNTWAALTPGHCAHDVWVGPGLCISDLATSHKSF